VQIDGRAIGTGKPGAMTRELTDAFQEIRVREGTKVEFPAEAVRVSG